MIARHQILRAPNRFIKVIHSTLQDNGITASKGSIASQKSNPDSSSFATETGTRGGTGDVAYEAEDHRQVLQPMTLSGRRFYWGGRECAAV
jgi:hypothetical protein